MKKIYNTPDEAREAENAQARRRRWDNPRKIAGRLLKEKRDWIHSIKTKCARCPETHTACLDFHHKDPATKIENVALMMSKMWSLERLKAEAAKCEILCSNCHRKLHWNEKRER